MQATFNAASAAHGDGTRELIRRANESSSSADVLKRLGKPTPKGMFACPSCKCSKPSATFKADTGDYGRRWRCTADGCDAGGSIVELVATVRSLDDTNAARWILGEPQVIEGDAGGFFTSTKQANAVEKEVPAIASNESRAEIVNMSNGSTRAAVRPRGSDDRQEVRLMTDQTTLVASSLIAAETTLDAAKAALRIGLRPIPIYAIGEKYKYRGVIKTSDGKPPIGGGWGKAIWTESDLEKNYGQNAERNVGLLMGPQGGIIDIEMDRPADMDAETFDRLADEELAELCGGEIPETVGWRSGRGVHRIFRWDDRLAVCAEFTKNAFHHGRLEIRLGAAKQIQSVIPPSRHATGERAWLGGSKIIASLPDVAIERIIEAAKPTPKPVKPPASEPVRSSDRKNESKRLDDEAKRLLGMARSLAQKILSANQGDTNTGRHPTALAMARTMAGLIAGHGRNDLAQEARSVLIEAYRDSKPELSRNDSEFEQCIGDGWNHGSQPGEEITLEDREPPAKPSRANSAAVESMDAPELPEEFGGPPAERSLADMGFTSGSDIVVEPIEYLIPGIMARGELTLIVGAAGSGKTKVAMARAARLTTGEGIDGKPVKGGPQIVAILSFEECPRRTIKPVCEHSGMDMDRVRIYEQPEGSAGVDSVPGLCLMLEKLADDGVTYVVIDSLTALYSRLGLDVNDTKAPYVIHGAINRVARNRNICVELIHHYGKASGAAYDNHQKAAGSYSIFASVRSVLQVEHDMTTGTRFIGVSPNKNNLGLLTDCLAFRTTRVAEHMNDGQGYIIAEIAGWNRDETIDDVSARITKAKNDELRKKVKPVAVEVAEAITSFIDNAGGVAEVDSIDKHLAKAGYASNAIRYGKKGFDKFQVRRVRKWFLTNLAESAARQIVDERFPEERADDGTSEPLAETSLGDENEAGSPSEKSLEG